MNPVSVYRSFVSPAAALLLLASIAGSWADSGSRFKQINLVSDQAGQAKYTDDNLVNPWGIQFVLGDLAVADNHAGVSTFYRPSGRPEGLVLPIPLPSDPSGMSAPVDFAFNEAALHGSSAFEVPVGMGSSPSVLIFVTEDGTIASWVPFEDTHEVVIALDNSGADAIYKSVALVKTHNGPFLYAANFHQGFVEMYDKNFGLVKTFTDSTLPDGFAPFGMRAFGGKLFVTFAKQLAPDNADDEAGPGLGYVDVFDTNGNLLQHLISQGPLNAPWGLAIAPRHFGRFGKALLVGNFGNGWINAFNPQTGAFLGALKDTHGHPIVIPGLWGLTFNPEGESDEPNLYFTAGPDDESHGLLGVLRPED